MDFVPSHGKHTGKDIAKIFFESVRSYGIENKIQGITVDNASANTKFMEELHVLMAADDIIFDLDTQHFRCFAHILHLGVQDIVKNVRLPNNHEYEDVSEDETDVDGDNLDGDKNCVTKLRNLFKMLKRSQLQNKLQNCCETTT